MILASYRLLGLLDLTVGLTAGTKWTVNAQAGSPNTWTSIAPPPESRMEPVAVSAGGAIEDIACAGAQDCRFITFPGGAGPAGILATADGGKTWQTQGFAGGELRPLLSRIACPAADTCYAVGGFTIVATHPPS